MASRGFTGELSANFESGMRQRRVCLVTFDLKGLTRNGGIGTAVDAMARTLSAKGFQVDILYSFPLHQRTAELFPVYQAQFLEQGIRLLLLPEPQSRVENSLEISLSYWVFEYLRRESYDVVHFPDMMGIGYHSILAKRMGLALQRTALCVTLHGPTSWHTEFNGTPDSFDRFELRNFLERSAVERADFVFGSTDYIFDWVASKGWILRGQKVKARLPLPEVSIGQSAKKLKIKSKEKRLVFFGRLETRKGIMTFCQALIHLGVKMRGIKVLFLGSESTVDGQPVAQYIESFAAQFDFDLEIVSDLNQMQALQFLCSIDSFVVIPSVSETLGYTVFECLQLGVPFTCSDIPAFRQLLPVELHDRLIFGRTADELAETIEEQFLRPNFRTRVPLGPMMLDDSRWVEWHVDRILREEPKLRSIGETFNLPIEETVSLWPQEISTSMGAHGALITGYLMGAPAFDIFKVASRWSSNRAELLEKYKFDNAGAIHASDWLVIDVSKLNDSTIAVPLFEGTMDRLLLIELHLEEGVRATIFQVFQNEEVVEMVLEKTHGPTCRRFQFKSNGLPYRVEMAIGGTKGSIFLGHMYCLDSTTNNTSSPNSKFDHMKQQ